MKHNQPMNQRGALHHAHNQCPHGFSPLVPSHGHLAHRAPLTAYQALTQPSESISQSLENTFKDFMKMISQSINEVRSATIVNTQAIAKLESQMGQITSHLVTWVTKRRESSPINLCPTQRESLQL
jgi:hypothetical protein